MTNLRRTALYLVGLAGAGYVFFLTLSDSSTPNLRAPAPAGDTGADRSTRPNPARRHLWRPASAGPQGPLLRVSGSVREGDTGAGVAGARVVLTAEVGEASATADAKGRFELRLLPGRYRPVVSAERYFAPAATPEILLEETAGSDRTARIDFVLFRAARVAGWVVDAHARPLAGATVALHRVARQRHAVRTLERGPGTKTHRAKKSDARGRFSIEVPPAEVVLRATHPKLGVALSRPVYLRPGADVTGIEIALGGGLSLAGQVIGPERRRVGASARVYLSDEHGTRVLPCDEEGRFSTANLTAGRKLLQAMASGFSPSRVTGVIVRPGASDKVIITLGAKRLVAGQVVDAGGQPVTGAAVNVRPGSPGRRPTYLLATLSATTDSLGRFELHGVPDVPLEVSAKGAGNTHASRAGVAPGTRDLRLQLQATGGITGRVSDGATGRPIGTFTVFARAPGASRTTRVVSPSGRYHLRDLIAGRYRLTGAASRYGPSVRPRVDVVAGSDVAAHLVLNASGRVSGVVVDDRGTPVPGARVKLETGWAGEEVTTGATGSFTLDDVARGRRSLTVSHPGHDTRILPAVSVFAAQTAVVRVELTSRAGKGAGLRLTGIGAVLAERSEILTVVKVLPRSPALVAGLRAGDRIKRIDGRESRRLGFGDAIEAIRGLAGTPVRLRIKRHDQSFQLDIVREEVSVPKD